MTTLLKAILFDLDDTILSAYARPEAAWLSIAEEFVEVVDKIIACSREFWSDPAQGAGIGACACSKRAARTSPPPSRNSPPPDVLYRPPMWPTPLAIAFRSTGRSKEVGLLYPTLTKW